VVWGRYAIARFNLETIGTPVHAGLNPKLGVSAVKEMAKRIIEIEDMSSENCTYSVSVVHGGQWVNCVASSAQAQALSMAKKQTDLDAGVKALLDLNTGTANDRLQFKVTRGVTRPVWEPNEATKTLYQHAQALSKELGNELPVMMQGGGSDANFTGAMGIATLDGLGVQGSGLHTLNEHIEVVSLATRGKLMAGLLATLS